MIQLKRKRGRPSKVSIIFEKAIQHAMEENKHMLDRKFEEILINGYCRISEEDLKHDNT